MTSVLRLEPEVIRWMPAALLLIAAGLFAWVIELGAVLQGQAEVRNWSSTWMGLDLMEITGLVLTAVLMRRRSAYLSAAAAVTATLFALDAWFDVLTAAAGADWYEALASAFFGEIPMTIVLAAIAVLAARPDRSGSVNELARSGGGDVARRGRRQRTATFPEGGRPARRAAGASRPQGPAPTRAHGPAAG
jgi:hypothetical protein